MGVARGSLLVNQYLVTILGRSRLSSNIYQLFYKYISPSVRHVGGLWPRRSVNWNNGVVVEKPQYSSFRKNKFGPYRAPLTPPTWRRSDCWVIPYLLSSAGLVLSYVVRCLIYHAQYFFVPPMLLTTVWLCSVHIFAGDVDVGLPFSAPAKTSFPRKQCVDNWGFFKNLLNLLATPL